MAHNFIHQIFNASPAPSLVLHTDSPKFTITEVNEAYLALVGRKREQLIGKGFFEAYPEYPYANTAPWKGLLDKLLDDHLPNQTPVSRFVVPVPGTGYTEVRYLVSTNTPVFNDNNEIECILRSVADVTEITKTRLNDTAFTKDKFLYDTQRIARIGSWEADVINEKLVWSDVVKEIYEVEADYEPDYTLASSFYDDEFREQFQMAIQETLTKGTLFDLELRIMTAKGNPCWIRITGKAELLDGVCTRVHGAIQDIHNRKVVEQQLIDSRNQFESLIQTIDGIVWEADASTFEFNFVSDQVEKMLGYTPEEWLGEPDFWKNHIHPDDVEKALGYCLQETMEVRNHDFDYRMRRADGEMIWIKDMVSVIHENGKPVLLRGFMVDITETKRLVDIEHLEKTVLELNSRKGSTLRHVLNEYLLGIERIFPSMKCSIVGIVNNRLNNWAAPSLPDEYIQSIENIPIGETAGSCGTAAFTRERVIVSDIANDPRWADYREVALPHKLLACWSHPIISSDDVVIATFAAYYEKVKVPFEEEFKIIDRVIAILTVVLENRQNSEVILASKNRLLGLVNELQKNNERYEFVNKATNDAIYDWDLKTDHIEWGLGYYRMFGFNVMDDQYPLAKWACQVHPEDREKTEISLQKQLSDTEKSKWTADYRFRKADDTYAHVVENGYILRDRQGKAVRMIGVLRDVTRQKQEEHDLKLLSSVITNTNDMVLIAESNPDDLTGLKILYVNAAFTKMTGSSPAEVIGKSPMVLRGFSPLQNDFGVLRNAIRNLEPLETETIRYQRNGESFDLNLSLHPVADDQGMLTHWISIGHDVTDRLRYIREIEEQNQKFQEIAWMQSHVIRAPLARLMSLVDLVKNYQNSEIEKTELLDHILTSAYSLDDIIRDISSKTEQL
ncbi:PAS domain-containing protein [Dyadobacter pollutisoli]|uniref:histidine kinase n=1 Tax=Dyadobacter pollutisoli TaxID=2910158 RepID=A0A9E8NFU8_9BACT|nr:PAS domain-containing protein [Dyadobacter pollutisoli]WAC14181.1 PAS domain-containing protein [Dyadobacter pollutisoli]